MATSIYFTIDEYNRVFPCCDNNGVIEPDPEWLSGEIEGNAYNEYAVPLWKYENEQCVRRTAEEIQADVDEIPEPEPTETEQLRADVDFLTMENEALESDMEQAQADIDYLLMLTEEI